MTVCARGFAFDAEECTWKNTPAAANPMTEIEQITPAMLKADYGHAPDAFAPEPGIDAYCLPHNETSTGVMTRIGRPVEPRAALAGRTVGAQTGSSPAAEPGPSPRPAGSAWCA